MYISYVMGNEMKIIKKARGFEMKCCLCNNVIPVEPITGWAEGNNAEPLVKNGRCCNECNNQVIFARIVGVEKFVKIALEGGN